MTIPRVLLATHACYLDDSSGAAVASRNLLVTLASGGGDVAVLCGSQLDGGEIRLGAGAAEGRWRILEDRPEAWTIRPDGERVLAPAHVSLDVQGVGLRLIRCPTTRPHEPDEAECGNFLAALGQFLDASPRDILLTYGGDRLTRSILAVGRARGLATVFMLHNFLYYEPSPFAEADAIVVPSAFAAEYYREALGLDCRILPNPIDMKRASCPTPDPGYMTFVNPSVEKGVYAFARIADELGRRRPDIPILVVESRGTEATVAACGLDLRGHGTVHFMAQTADPRDFWGVTKVCLLPSTWWENQPLVAVEAMLNGIPVIGSDRGGIPETLGDSGIVLPLPDRITPATRMLPTAEEVAPWVEAVIRLWDDAEFYREHRRRALDESRRWAPEILGPWYVEFFRDLKPGPKVTPTIPPGRARSVVLVPHLGGIEPECEDSLRKLEAAGVRVVRSGGNSAIDVARNRMASEALHDGAESILFVDSDIGFDPLDALRLLSRPEPVVSGVYAKKGVRQFASVFAEGVDVVTFGARAFGLYPLKYAAAGFLRIRASVLRRMIETLGLPRCNTHWGRGEWPFFQPAIVPQGEGREHYLGEDWAFSDRLARIGVTPMADTSIRLWHYGRYGYGWEDVGAETKRFATSTHHFGSLGDRARASPPADPH